MVARPPQNEIQRLRELVDKRGVESVASLVGVNKGTISRWYNDVFRPRGLYLERLRERLPAPAAPPDRLQVQPNPAASNVAKP